MRQTGVQAIPAPVCWLLSFSPFILHPCHWMAPLTRLVLGVVEHLMDFDYQIR
jgi:hypothetical protein